MSQTNDAASSCSDMESEQRERKLTEKGWMYKVEKLQKERKRVVDKIKGLIPKMKELMKQEKNVSEVKQCMENLNTLCENATTTHNELLPLIPEDEFIKQKEWFSSIMNYSNTFQRNTQEWIVETEQKISQEHQDSSEMPLQPVEMNEVNEIEDNIKPSDSVSNVGSHKTSQSQRSSTSSIRLKAEAELAALSMRHKLLKEKHALEEEEQRLRKKREELQLNTEIAEKMAKLEILKIRSTTSGKGASKVSDGMNSYLEKVQSKQLLNVDADEFTPKQIEINTNTNPNITSYEQNQLPMDPSFNTHDSHGQPGFNTMDLEPRNDVLGIMRKQNEITTLLVQQQSLSALPKREIPIYDGDPLEYHMFIKAFENGVERNTTNSGDCLYFLEQHTKGHAKELVRSCQHINSERGYVKAKALLKEQFGNEQKVASAYMDKALSWPSIRAEDVKALQDYSLFLRGCCNSMEDVQYLSDMDMPSNMLCIIKKLPYKLRDRWRNHACELQERHKRRAKFTDIANFIERQVKILTDPVFGNIQDSQPITINRGTNKPKPQLRPGNKGSSFATTIGPVENKYQSARKEKEIKQTGRKVCICCGGGHALDVCVQMGRMPHQRKIGFLKENGICFGCLCTGHISKDCRKRISCSRCSLKHPTILHKEPVNDSEQTKRSPEPLHVDSTLVSSGLTGAGDQDCKLPIVPVQVKSNKGTKTVITYAFLDQGSTAVFCTESLMHKLHLTGRKGRILLRTMGQEKVVSSNIVSGLEVAALEGDNFLELPRAYTQESMPVHRENIPTERDIEQWSHLKHIRLPQIDAGIELLIGTNVPKALEPLEVVCSVDEGPYAIRTLLGWTVNGPLSGNSGETVNWEHPQVTVNRVSVVNLDDLWQQQFKNDFPESSIDEQPGMSKEDERFLQFVTNSAKEVEGHYQIALPLRNSDISMPNNKKVVEQRLCYLKRRFQKDSRFHTEYNTFISDLLAKGYAEKVPKEDLDRGDGKVWYIPHHGVYHPTKRKIRVVFDCGARYQGTSLNAELLQGPDLTSSLIGVVTRFRKEPIVIMADIESMFHQVQVPPDDRDLLRFLWWPKGDIQQLPAEYRMKVHLFGATSSPSCANFALRKCAEDHGHCYSKETVDKLLHCFYVDDCLVAVATEKEAVSLYKNLVSLCSKGGFSLTKWLSNRSGVLEVIPENQRAKSIEGLDMELDSLPVERVLGVEWSIKSDSFKFKIVLKDRPLTRRGILSTVSSIYDPLGMLSPVVLTAKKILRDLCRRGIGWDDTVPESVSKEWLEWLRQLHLLDKFEVSRCMKPTGFGEVTSAQLHHFCDSSEHGYGTVTYLLLKNKNMEVHSAFVMGKARVAPLKCVTIPRMELIAATMASRIDMLWRKELQMALLDSVFWTDSTSVLKYIRNETSRFKVFVANRVTQILKVSCSAQWRYVDTSSNPADIASRGVKVDAFVVDTAWVSGPHFLLHPESEWPVYPDDLHHLSLDDPEVKRVVAVNVVQAREEPVTHLIEYFSSWTSLKKSVAWLLRIKSWLMSCVKKRRQLHLTLAQSDINKEQQESSVEEQMKDFKRTAVHRSLTVVDLDEAELAIVKFCQGKRFPEELICLEKGQPVKRSSHLHKLCLQLQDGILRVGGRLSRLSMPVEEKHPIILAKDLHISELLLRHVHQEVGHGGRNHMLSKLRERYWIAGVSSAIRRVLAKCIICRRLNALPVYQQMADLPHERIVPDEPPFTRVGVDCFGPFEVKSRRSMVKRYGVLFTCLAIRAVHIEVASSLDTDSFINALRRFTARRGQVRELRSDNGTNFVGGERELKKAIEQWNQVQIHDVMLQKGIQWSFNPPTGSHHGGAWERLIRSVRKVLNSTLKVQNLDEEGLHTVLCEIEAIINSRPITKASMDPNDLEALTPNHLLLLKTSPTLPPGVFQPSDIYVHRRWKQAQYMSDLFWRRWVREYLPQLQERQRWTGVKRNLVVGDLVIIMDSTAPRNSWPVGRVIQTFPDRRGFVRQVRIKTRSSCLDRPITKVCLLQEAEAI